ncbi:MAG TPA: DUF1549 domain-containing protein [Gemmataceae bacterium]|nr:DUF1549 domain-containing protein [Gemmataceae bacterium]
MLRSLALVVAGMIGLGSTEPARADALARVTQLTVEPAQITLRHADDRQQLIITGKLPDGSARDLTRDVQFGSSNPGIAVVSSRGVVAATGAGQANIHVVGAGLAAIVPVTVKGIAGRPISFANDVMPVLAKAGCNSGACHGAASGKKGFKLSLRGYDPPTDYLALTRGTEGRRIDRNLPEHSLILLKPTGLTPHEGGKRFDTHSEYAGILRRWIAEGAQSDLAKAPELIGLDVSPKFRTFPAPGQKQQLLVTARFSDGSTRDVTADARYSSNNETAAEVDEAGLVAMPNKGEATLMARYGSHLAVGTMVVLKRDPSFAWTNPAENNYVDKLVNAKLKEMEILPSELTGDEEFLRRVYYDVIGVPPTPKEVREFLADKRADKRARAIDALLERPEHGEFWALKWADLLRVRFDILKDKGTWGLYRWIRDSIAKNKRFDQFVREIITADGSCAENPAANYYRVFTNPDDATEATAQIFFGIRLLCAKCHDHPFEKWVQKDYYGMSAFFTQVSRKNGSRANDQIVFRAETPAQARHPRTGETLDPKLLDAKSGPVAADRDAREVFADWMTRKDNPFFARATVNRLWSHLFGKGIIDPVDDIRSSNPPVNAPLLDALTKDFIDHDFDVRHILRTMLSSRTYQLSARTNKVNVDDTQNFSHASPRRLSAEQLLDTLSQATGIRENFISRFPGDFGAATVALPSAGLRATQLPDKQLTAPMLDLFGRPKGESTCACERHEEASMTQALHLINGKSVAERLADPKGRVTQLVQTPKITNEQVIEELYLLALSRKPQAKETELMKKHFASNGDRLKAAQDALWVLFNTREFLFNH